MATTAHHHRHHHHHLPQKPIDLEITIVSAKHLKNVNWRNGDLNPYAIFWVDPDRRLATKSDDSNSTKPVWNERFVIPLPSTPFAAVLTLEIFHFKPSDTPKPLVGTLRLPLGDLPDPQNPTRIRTFDVRRPSGRPNGKIRLKLALRERALPDYQNTQQPPFYYGRLPSSSPSPYGSYSSLQNPPPPPGAERAAPVSAPRQAPPPSHNVSHSDPYGSYSSLQNQPPPPGAAPPSAPRQALPPYHNVSHSDPYPVYYQGGYYSQQPPPSASPRPSIDRQLSHGSVGGGPMEYGQYDQKPRNGKIGSGSGLAFGTNTGGVAGLAIDEGMRYEDGKIGESDMGVKKADEYVYYRRVDY